MMRRGKLGEAFYFRALDEAPSGAACVLSLGIRETMQPGFIRHSGPDAEAGYLLIDFHGPAFVELGGRSETVQRGLVLWRPGTVRHYGNPNAPWLHSWMNVAGPAIDEAVAERAVPRDQAIHADLSAISLKYLHGLYDELQEHVTPDDQIVEALLGIWIREIARATGSGGATPPPRVTEARRYIEAHYAEPLELGDLARRAVLSVSQFSAVFKSHFGVPPMQYAHRLRLRKAARLLSDATLAVSDVAARVGYEDALYFSRQFRKYMGQSPRDYRRSRMAQP